MNKAAFNRLRFDGPLVIVATTGGTLILVDPDAAQLLTMAQAESVTVALNIDADAAQALDVDSVPARDAVPPALPWLAVNATNPPNLPVGTEVYVIQSGTPTEVWLAEIVSPPDGIDWTTITYYAPADTVIFADPDAAQLLIV